MGNKPQKNTRETSKSDGESKSEKAKEEVITETNQPNSTEEVSPEVSANSESKTTEEILEKDKDLAQKMETVEVKVDESKPCDAKEIEANTKKDVETEIHVVSVSVEQKSNPAEELETKESSIKSDDVLPVIEEQSKPAHPVITDGDSEKEIKHAEEVKKEEEPPVKCNNISSVTDPKSDVDIQIIKIEVEEKVHCEPAVKKNEEVTGHENSSHTVEPEISIVENN